VFPPLPARRLAGRLDHSTDDVLAAQPAVAEGLGVRGGGQFTVGWICSFSLPIITICAFICLNIFLSLFDLIFGWMFFIKICIPFPKRSES